MKLIAAADRGWSIGNKGSLLVRIPGDQRMFRQETMGKTIVYGRKTLETFPLAQPLDGRRNVILSRDTGRTVRGAEVVHSLEEALDLLRDVPEDEIYIIGGETVYRQFLPYCDTAIVTRIDYEYEADAFLPDLDADPDWTLASESDEMTFFDVPYTFCTYVRTGGGCRRDERVQTED